MGSTGSTLNSLEKSVARRELSKPLDGSDVMHSGEAAIEEVVRLRKELRYFLDKEEFKKRKNGNKWRRGSFGQIKKAQDFWDKRDREDKVWEEGEDVINADNVEEMMRKMTADMEDALNDENNDDEKVPPPKNLRLRNLDERVLSNSPAGGSGSGRKVKRRSFVLEKGLTLVDSDEEEDM